MLHDDTMLTTMFDRRIVPPYGLQGGGPGASFRCTLVRANGDSSEVPGKANVRLHATTRQVVNEAFAMVRVPVDCDH